MGVWEAKEDVDEQDAGFGKDEMEGNEGEAYDEEYDEEVLYDDEEYEPEAGKSDAGAGKDETEGKVEYDFDPKSGVLLPGD